ncbi:hypothetical protein PMAYCL1PPCAC_28295, partial [Pristionchus mayeri]
ENLQAVLPEVRMELSLLTNATMMVDRPGYPGQQVNLREIASHVIFTRKSSADKWGQMANFVLDEVLPREVQLNYSGAAKAVAYYPLPRPFVDGIIQCCMISSNMDTQGMVEFLPKVSSCVRAALKGKLNEMRKNESKDLEVLKKNAIALGWTPP